VEIRDDVALGIPNEAGPGSLRYLVKVQSKQIALNSDRVMLTTAGEACLKSPMVDFSSDQSSPRGETARGAALGSFKVALTIQACRPDQQPMR
jgi:hypothetical protein